MECIYDKNITYPEGDIDRAFNPYARGIRSVYSTFVGRVRTEDGIRLLFAARECTECKGTVEIPKNWD